MNRETPKTTEPSAAPKTFSSLRPDPSTLFSRASVATVALANAIVLAGSAEAQTPAASPSPSPAPQAALTSEAEGAVTMAEVVVTAENDSYQPPKYLESPRRTAPILDTPQTINVVPRAVIEDQNATTLRDVLRNVPGISMQAGEGGAPAGDNLSIRGFNARTDIFVDNVRDLGGYTRDPFNYEQVEVAKGPSAVYAGRGATGGSVNIVTKTPQLDAFYTGDLGVGTDSYQRYTLDLNQPLPTLPIPGTAFRLNLLWSEAGVPDRDWVEGSRWGIAPSLSFGLGTDTKLTLTYLHLQQENVPDYGIPWVPATNIPLARYANQAPPVNFENYYGLLRRDYESTITDIGTVIFEHNFNESITLTNTFRYGQNNRDSIISSPRFASTTTTDITRELKSRDQIDKIIADQIDLTLKFDTFGFGHVMDLGAEYAYEYSKNHVRTGPKGPVTDLYDPNPQDHYAGPITSGRAFNKAISRSLGLYAFDTIKLHEQLEVSGGVRWDTFSVDYESKPADASPAVTPPTTYLEREDRFVSWRIGPVYKPLPNGSIYMAYGTSFNPSAEGLTLSTSTNLLDPETSATWEFGTKWELFKQRLSVNAAIFRINKDNARTPGLTPDDPPTVLEGQQRVDGLELGLSGSITEEWKVYGGYSYINSQILHSNNPAEVGRRLPNTPQNTFSLWTTYELPWGITIGGGAQYVGSRFNDAANLRKAPDYWTFDAMLSYPITKNITARLNIYNLADEKYIDRLGGGHFIPGAGRSGTLTVSFKF